MKCTILHDTAGRIRVHLEQPRMSLLQADILEAYLRNTPGVADVTVHDRTGNATILYTGQRAPIVAALAVFSYEKSAALAPEHSVRVINREYEGKLIFRIVRRYTLKLILPAPLRAIRTVIRSLRFLRDGIRCLLHGKIEVPVLDATAIAVSILRGDFETAGSVIFLLGIGELLDEWTHKKSVADLAGTMALQVDKVWLETTDGSVAVPVGDVRPGDRIIVRTGGMIPLDGHVVAGEAMVNQASITGEGLAVRRTAGSYVYAGTVVEEGECTIRVDKSMGSGRYDRIVHMIEESEKLKSDTEAQASHLADRLVPYSLGATGLIWLLTRNVNRALAVLMVDFSCALKLSMPIAVLSGMKEAGIHHISVKGGRFMEAVAQADTIVFDKTGTLTYAVPRLVDVVAFGDQDPDEMLRVAACLEEHYPHSMANAIVRGAQEKGLNHEELHTKVEYIVAHGVSSHVGEKKVVIGSYHFVLEDEHCTIPAGEEAKLEAIDGRYSRIYLAIDGELAAVLCIFDPVRKEAAEVIGRLRALGIRTICMMTGDSERTAASVAAQLGLDHYQAEVLPEDKVNYVKSRRAAGHKVIMVGDGINDSPALSEADVGVAIGSGAAITREIADITISADDLMELVVLRRLSRALMNRVHGDYRFIVGFNSLLIALGIGGIITPSTSALLHNSSTMMVDIDSMTNLLEETK